MILLFETETPGTYVLAWENPNGNVWSVWVSDKKPEDYLPCIGVGVNTVLYKKIIRLALLNNLVVKMTTCTQF